MDCCNRVNYPTQCSRSAGCNGGWSEDALQFVALQGIALSSDYPYVEATNNCNSGIPTYSIITTPYANLTSGSVTTFQAALNVRTVGVGVYASTWSLYASGVYSCKKRVSYRMLNHMVLLVGYNSTSWKIKNSWGTTWGVNGYMTLTLTGNNCGLLLEGITTVAA